MLDERKDAVGSVSRALQLLDIAPTDRKLSVQGAADRLSINRSSAYRLLETMRRSGYLHKSGFNVIITRLRRKRIVPHAITSLCLMAKLT